MMEPEETGHETEPSDRWPDDVLREDHPTPDNCVSTANTSTGPTAPSNAAMADGCG